MTAQSASYTPELGQACFGQPWFSASMPDAWETYLDLLGHEVAHVTGNEPPTWNSGSAFYCDDFALCSYRWDDEDEQPNFRHHATGLEIRWYKHAHRGTTTNDPTADFRSIALECIDALRGGCSFTTDPTEHKALCAVQEEETT